MVPAVVVHCSNEAECCPGPGMFQPSVLFATRPPVIDDFFDDTLAMSVDIRAVLKMVKITTEVSLVPRML